MSPGVLGGQGQSQRASSSLCLFTSGLVPGQRRCNASPRQALSPMGRQGRVVAVVGRPREDGICHLPPSRDSATCVVMSVLGACPHLGLLFISGSARHVTAQVIRAGLTTLLSTPQMTIINSLTGRSGSYVSSLPSDRKQDFPSELKGEAVRHVGSAPCWNRSPD